MFIICIVSTYGKRREKGRKGYFIPLLPQRWTAFSKYHLIMDFERFFSDHTFLIFIQLLNILQRKKSCLLKVYLLIISIITTALLPTKPPSPVPNCLLQVTFTSLILMPAGLSAALKTGFRAKHHSLHQDKHFPKALTCIYGVKISLFSPESQINSFIHCYPGPCSPFNPLWKLLDSVLYNTVSISNLPSTSTYIQAFFIFYLNYFLSLLIYLLTSSFFLLQSIFYKFAKLILLRYSYDYFTKDFTKSWSMINELNIDSWSYPSET